MTPPPASSARDALRETFVQLDALRESGARAAMATLVSTEGTSPKLDGAKMWVAEHGRILGGVTIGGCVDARVVEAAERVLATNAPALLDVPLSDAQGWELGLSCGGSVQVMVEPVSLRDPTDPVMLAYDVVRGEREAGRRAAAVMPLGGAAARLVVREDGSTCGTLGSDARDRAARAAAVEALARGTSGAAALGEDARCFVEVHAPPTTLIIYGAGPVAAPLAAIARTLGWRTVIVDARERWATRERFPHADEIRTGIVGDIAEEFAYDRSTLVVITAHDYKFELPVLRAVLRREPAYIGLLGSRKRGRALKEFLAAEGFTAEELARVHVPVGLDLGAATAAEIALAVAAEALAARNGRPARPLSEGA
jgi:xanthine dehydrogenase accessory factor